MATTTSLRSRRNEAQLHALAGVEREIRISDPGGRRKYLQDFSSAFQTYQSVLLGEELRCIVGSADIVLIGDYHALASAQRFAGTLLEQRAHAGDRPVVLGVETIFARDQHILEEWWRREIGEEELRRRIRFDLDWGYDWTPFHDLLVTAREHAEGVYGLDCMPREDLRKIGARDRHAAHKVAELRALHPNAAIFVLFGESHLAPTHLPKLLREQLPQQRVLTVLQNVDPLYWKAAGELQSTQAVRVAEDVVCVFNSTPLEKYESYRLHLSRWGRGEEEGPDLVPTIYNLIDSLLRFLDINRYSSHNGTQPKFLVDLLPEVFSGASEANIKRLIEREEASETTRQSLLRRLEDRGCLYLPRQNAFYVREFQMMYAAEEVSRFLHHACRGLPARTEATQTSDVRDSFHIRACEQALGFFGSRLLYPARPPVEDDIQFSRTAWDDMMRAAAGGDQSRLEASAQHVGYILGSALYDDYLQGNVSRKQVRDLFLAHLEEPGRARGICQAIANHGLPPRKRPQSVRTVTASPRRTTA